MLGWAATKAKPLHISMDRGVKNSSTWRAVENGPYGPSELIISESVTFENNCNCIFSVQAIVKKYDMGAEVPKSDSITKYDATFIPFISVISGCFEMVYNQCI